MALRAVPMQQLYKALTSVSPGIIFSWVALASFSLWLRSLRWRILLSAVGAIPMATVFPVYAAGQLGNAVLPARLGDVYRATNLGRAGVSSGFTLATILGERLLDTGFLVFISALASATFPELPVWLVRGSRAFALVALAGIGCALMLPRLEYPLSRFIASYAPSRYAGRFNHLVQQFICGLRSLRRPSRVGLFMLFTTAIWSLDAGGAVILARGLSITLSPAVAVLLLTALALSSALPAAPGNIGVYQLVTVSVLGSFAVSRSQAFALAVLLQALIVANLLIWGIGSSSLLRLRKDLSKEGRGIETMRDQMPELVNKEA
jgi:uncharacterized protein (TIRG00374 family)